MNDKDLKQYFEVHKSEIPDDGFSGKVMEDLPRTSSPLLPLLVICGCLLLALVLLLVSNGFTPFFEEIWEMALSLSRLQMPSLASIGTYFTGIIIIGSISFAIYRTDSV